LSNATEPATITPEPPEAKFRRPLILTDGDVFTRIWKQPRLVFNYLSQYEYDRYTYVFLFIAAATTSLELAIASHLNKGMTFSFIISISIIAGGLFWTLIYYTFAAVASRIGEWFGGQATTISIVRVMAYGMFPIIMASLFTILKILLFDIDLFREDFSVRNYGPGLSAFYVISSLSQFALAISSIYLIVIGMSQVQQMPIGVAILNLILPALILAVALAIIVIPFL
jgi:Yip1 domain